MTTLNGRSNVDLIGRSTLDLFKGSFDGIELVAVLDQAAVKLRPEVGISIYRTWTKS